MTFLKCFFGFKNNIKRPLLSFVIGFLCRIEHQVSSLPHVFIHFLFECHIVANLLQYSRSWNELTHLSYHTLSFKSALV